MTKDAMFSFKKFDARDIVMKFLELFKFGVDFQQSAEYRSWLTREISNKLRKFSTNCY